MSKFYAYHYSDEDNGDVLVITPVKVIVRERFTYAEKHNFHYVSTEQAITDFIVVHWAYPCTYTGAPTNEPIFPVIKEIYPQNLF